MTTRERILAIKLLERQERNPEYARQVGIQVSMLTQYLTEKEKENDCAAS